MPETLRGKVIVNILSMSTTWLKSFQLGNATCSHETRAKKVFFSWFFDVESAEVTSFKMIYYLLEFLNLLSMKTNISFENSFVFYWYVTSALGFISWRVLATLGFVVSSHKINGLWLTPTIEHVCMWYHHTSSTQATEILLDWSCYRSVWLIYPTQESLQSHRGITLRLWHRFVDDTLILCSLSAASWKVYQWGRRDQYVKFTEDLLNNDN